MNTLDPLHLPLRQRQIIEASAGTGKTWTLAALYVRLVIGHGRVDQEPLMPSQILVMTFTEAATAELRERVRNRLHQAASWFESTLNARIPPKDPFLQGLSQDMDKDFWPECVRRLHLAAQAMDEAAIYTIHGWSRRMLSSFALMSRDLFEQTHLDNPNALLQQLVRDHWRKWYYPLPFELQRIVLSQIGTNPDVLLENIQSLWKVWDLQPPTANHEALPPPLPLPVEILQPYLEWQQHTQALEAKARQAWQTNLPEQLHAARSHGLIKAQGISDKYFAIWVTQLTDWASHGRTIPIKTLARFTAEKLQACGWKSAADFDFFHRVSLWVQLADPEPVCAPLLVQHAAHELRAAYQLTKLQQSQFDFNDLLQRLHQALRNDAGDLADAIRQQYPVAMVDEFQDTDPWQYESLDRIYDITRVNDKHALVMIGDPKQAIYSFRGADLDTYLLARRTALEINPDACHTLDTNYRSAPGLVNAVNLLFGSLAQPFRAKQQTIEFVKVKSAADAVPLADASGRPAPPLTFWHMPLPVGMSDKPYWPAELHVQNMAKGFASQMAKLLNTHSDIHPGHMAVLVRSHAHAQAMQSALAQAGLPSVFLSDHANVYHSPQAIDLWRVLRAISMPRHMRWLRSAMASKLWAWPVHELTQAMHNPELCDALAESCQQWLQVWQRQGVLPMLYQWMHSQDIAKRLLSQPRGDRQLTNLLQLGELLQTAAASLQGPQALLQFLAQQLQAGSDNPEAQKMRLETDAHCVQVVTFHKSKGLEYPLVFVPFLGSFKASSSSKDDEDTDITESTTDEDMRLLYVALTRAKRGMWLGVAATSKALSGKAKTLKRSAVSELLQRQHHEDLPERLQSLFGHCDDIAVAELPMETSVVYEASASHVVSQAALVAQRKPYSRWWMASFSSLTRGIEAGSQREEAQSDAWTDAIEHTLPDDSPRPHNHAVTTHTHAHTHANPAATDFWQIFPRGARYGSLLHDLLEWQAQQAWPLAQVATPGSLTEQAWQQLLDRKTRGLNLPAHTAQALPDALRAVVSAPLPLGEANSSVPPVVLSLLTASQLWPEMEFQLGAAHLSSTRVDQWITEHVLPGQARAPLPPRTLQGMLTGFIDLVFEHDGRYWVLDYKSNGLPNYEPATLNNAVLDKRYDVQYVLYILALHRLLSSRLPNYDYEQHVGGAVYVFLRGLQSDGAGVHHMKPPYSLIQQLDRAFIGVGS